MAQRLCVSLRQIKEHEIHTTLRYLRKHGEKWSDTYLRYGEIQQDLTQKLLKTGSSLLLYYFALSTLADETAVSVTVQGYTASIPLTYVTLLASITLYFFGLQFQSLLMLFRIRAREGSRMILPGFSANSFGFLMGQDDLALVTPIHNNRFLRERLGSSSILAFLTTITVLAFLLPVCAFVLFLSKKHYYSLIVPNLPLDQLFAACLGCLIVIFMFIFVVLFNLPLPVGRNSYHIRWGLLTRLYPAGSHPRLDVFLADEKTNNRGP